MVHLHRRAVFGASWNEIQRDLASDPQSSVTRILDGTCRLGGVPSDFNNLANIIGSAATASGNSERLKAWWIYRILFAPHCWRARPATLAEQGHGTSREAARRTEPKHIGATDCSAAASIANR